MTCADWRLHQRVVDFNSRIGWAVKAREVDLIALPGPDGLLRPDRAGEWAAGAGPRASSWPMPHHAPSIALVAHQRCAGHPVSDDLHDNDVQAVAQALKASLGFSGPVYALVATFSSGRKRGLKTVGKF